ncbi:hypothetical protein [Methylobacterium sp. JK268]
MRSRVFAALLALLSLAVLTAPAAAFTAQNATKYPSPDLYRPNVDDVIVQGGIFSGFSLRNILAALRPQVDNVAALKTSPTWFNSIRRNGFAAPGDGGAMDYTWSAANCTAPDDGAQVQPTGRIGCWIADPAGSEVDIRIWGARPAAPVYDGASFAADVADHGGANAVVNDRALASAFAWACKTHIPLYLPYPGSLQYHISTPVVIGNGSRTSYSTCNNVSLKIKGAYTESTPGTSPPLGLPFSYIGPATNQAAFTLQGPAAVLNMEGVGVDCHQRCAYGFNVVNVLNNDWKRIVVQGHTRAGLRIVGTQFNTWGGSSEGSRYRDMWLVVPGPGGGGMEIGDSACVSQVVVNGVVTNPDVACNQTSVIADKFENVTINWDSQTDGVCGIRFGVAQQLTFERMRITYDPVRGGNKGNPICISPPPGDFGFPTDIKFDGMQFQGVVDPGPANWVPYSGGIRFEGYNTAQSPFPYSTTYGLYTGTDTSRNEYPGPASWTPVDASGAGLALNVANANYIKRGKTCTVTFALTYPTTANAAWPVIGGIPAACTPLSSPNAQYGGPAVYSDAGFLPNILASNTGGQLQIYNALTGGGIRNADLSGKQIRGSITFPTN